MRPCECTVSNFFTRREQEVANNPYLMAEAKFLMMVHIQFVTFCNLYKLTSMRAILIIKSTRMLLCSCVKGFMG